MARKRADKPEVSKVQDAEAEVGYRKPPKSTQFKPGVSGNPRGRSKKSKQVKTFAALFRDYLRSPVAAREEGGRVKLIPRGDAVMHKVFSEAMSGNAATLRQLLKLMQDEIPVDDVVPPATDLSPEEFEILKRYMKRREEDEVAK